MRPAPLPQHYVPAATPAAAQQPARYLTNNEAAAFLRLSPRTLEKQRVIGAIIDLETWADARSFEMTSDPEYTARRPGVR
jgi:hypothetical protein